FFPSTGREASAPLPGGVHIAMRQGRPRAGRRPRAPAVTERKGRTTVRPFVVALRLRSTRSAVDPCDSSSRDEGGSTAERERRRTENVRRSEREASTPAAAPPPKGQLGCGRRRR